MPVIVGVFHACYPFADKCCFAAAIIVQGARILSLEFVCVCVCLCRACKLCWARSIEITHTGERKPTRIAYAMRMKIIKLTSGGCVMSHSCHVLVDKGPPFHERIYHHRCPVGNLGVILTSIREICSHFLQVLQS